MSSYLTNKANIIISQGAIPTPAEIASQFSPMKLKPDFESIATENSGRADGGYMHLEWVYRRVRKLEIELRPHNVEYISSILNLVHGRTYYITFWDLITNSEMTKFVYTSTSSAD